VALACAVNRLRKQGFALFDTQFITPHLASLGGVEIPRAVYEDRLADALKEVADFGPTGPIDLDQMVQSMTHTS
jgi:leucyl/phenylalanyl-tRNA--protein transferase